MAHFNRGNALSYLKRFDEAVASYDKAIALQPDLADAYSNRGVALKDLKRFDEAVASYDRAIALKPDNGLAYAERMYSKIMTCDWRNYAAEGSRLRGMVDGGTEVLPFICARSPPTLASCADRPMPPPKPGHCRPVPSRRYRLRRQAAVCASAICLPTSVATRSAA